MALLVRTVSTISSTGVLHILQDVLHDVLGDMLVLVVYAYSGSATPRASLRSWMSALVGHATSAV